MRNKHTFRVKLSKVSSCAVFQDSLDLTDKFTHVWVDGASRNLDGSIGIIVVYQGIIRMVIGEYLGKNCSNNVAEVLAIKRGLELVELYKRPVKIYSDSRYALNSIHREFNGPKNRKIIEDTIQYITTYPMPVEFIKVKGHSDLPYNVLADQVAATMLPSLSR